ncbi:MAG: D-aminoacyl-tRNA deacylase [Acidimicrobiales bacterium]
MRALVQRVTWARILVGAEVVSQLGEPPYPAAPQVEAPQVEPRQPVVPGPGLLVLVGVTHGDTPDAAMTLAGRLWNLRLLADEGGRMNRSCSETGGGLIVVSQFTLYGDISRGRRPSWLAAAPGDVAEPIVDAVVEGLRSLGAAVGTGRFGADMTVELANDGPATLLIEL